MDDNRRFLGQIHTVAVGEPVVFFYSFEFKWAKDQVRSLRNERVWVASVASTGCGSLGLKEWEDGRRRQVAETEQDSRELFLPLAHQLQCVNQISS